MAMNFIFLMLFWYDSWECLKESESWMIIPMDFSSFYIYRARQYAVIVLISLQNWTWRLAFFNHHLATKKCSLVKQPHRVIQQTTATVSSITHGSDMSINFQGNKMVDYCADIGSAFCHA